MLEKTPESPLDCKEIKSVNSKGNQSWIFIGRTDAKAEAPILWPPDVKGHLIGKDPDPGKDWRWEKKGTAEDDMVGWHHNLINMSLNKLLEMVRDSGAWRAVVHGFAKSWTQLSNRTTATTPTNAGWIFPVEIKGIWLSCIFCFAPFLFVCLFVCFGPFKRVTCLSPGVFLSNPWERDKHEVFGEIWDGICLK